MSNVFLFSKQLGRAGNAIFRAIKYTSAYLLSTKSCNHPPRIVTFHANDQLLIQGGVLKLVWHTKYTAFVHIDGLGYFLNRSETALPIHFEERAFTLTAFGFLRRNSRTITLKSLQAPTLSLALPKNTLPVIESTVETRFYPKQYKYNIHYPALRIPFQPQLIEFPDL